MPKDNAKYKGNKAKITATLADKLKPQKKTPRPGDKGPRYNVNRLWDTDIKGFYLQCGTGGTKTWYLRYTNEYQKKQTYKIGRYPIITVPSARKEALIKLGEAQTIDIQKLKRQEITQGSVAEYSKAYLKRLPHYKSKHREVWCHERRIVPHIGKLKLKEVDRETIMTLLKKFDHLGADWVRLKVMLHKFFKEMLLNRRIPYNPVADIPTPKDKRYVPRQVVLTAQQKVLVAEYLAQQLKVEPINCYYIALLLAIGPRPGELLKLPWKQVDLLNGTMGNLSIGEGAETKTGKKDIPISPTAIKYFKELHKLTGSFNWCFPGKKPNKPLTTMRFFFDKIRKYAGIPKVQLRDFRRTFTTAGGASGVDMHAVSKIMQHANINITAQVYDQVDDDRKRKALKKIKGVALI